MGIRRFDVEVNGNEHDCDDGMYCEYAEVEKIIIESAFEAVGVMDNQGMELVCANQRIKKLESSLDFNGKRRDKYREALTQILAMIKAPQSLDSLKIQTHCEHALK